MITCIKEKTACNLSMCENCNPIPKFILQYTSLGRMLLVPNPDYKTKAGA